MEYDMNDILKAADLLIFLKTSDINFFYISSSLVADAVVFNSEYNRDSFLGSIKTFLNIIPDQKALSLEEQIRPKSLVLYFPLNLSHIQKEDSPSEFVHDDLDVDCQNDDKVTAQKRGSRLSDSEPTTTTCGCPGDKMTVTKGFHDNQCSKNSMISEITRDVNHENVNSREKKLESSGNCAGSAGDDTQKHLHIVWAHRW